MNGHLADRRKMGVTPMHIIFIADASGSMGQDGKMAALNMAMRKVDPCMKQRARTLHNVQVFAGSVKFSKGAEWHIPVATPIEQFEWADLMAGGCTDMGTAFSLVAKEMHSPPMPFTLCPPRLILVSDGEPTDDYAAGLKELLDSPYGGGAIRLAIAIGRGANTAVLNEFIANPEISLMTADNPEELAEHITAASELRGSGVNRTRGISQDPAPGSYVIRPQVTRNQASPSPRKMKITADKW